MRLDKRLNRDGLQIQQLFFIECWSSLASRNNIDSDRVTYNNPLNAVEELLDIYALGDKFRASNKRRHVMTELAEMLELDPTLQEPPFENLPQQILALFEKQPNGERNLGSLEDKKALMISFLTQLQGLIKEHYRNTSIQKLSFLLLEQQEFNESIGDNIYYITNMLISSLLTLGMPLSECYLLYKNFLMRREEGFEENFGTFIEKIKQTHRPITISLKLISERLYSLIGTSGTEIEFRNCQFVLIDHPNKNTVAVNIDVEAISFSAARFKAEKDLNSSLDIIAYMMGKDDIQTVKRYSANIKDTQGNVIESKDLPNFDQSLGNASDRLGLKEFELYISTMSRLHKNANERTINKINSTFRFFRNSVTDNTAESRFTAFWSALESLTLGVSEDSLSHDEHVILSVLPSIGLDYPVKQLFALRGVAKTLGWRVFTYATLTIDYKTADLGDIYESLKNPDLVLELYQRLGSYPYARYRFGKFISLCDCPYKIGAKIQYHRSKVELQIHRLYRARNAIVHNASAQDRLDMLVVNLEHYLRGTLNAMVYMMDIAPSISSPEEAFNRYQHQSDAILSELDPSYPLSIKKREGMRKQITNGTITLNDEKLVQWLAMHS